MVVKPVLDAGQVAGHEGKEIRRLGKGVVPFGEVLVRP